MATNEQIAWDRSHEWEIVRHTQHQVDVAVRFKGSQATVAELVALRKCVPRYRRMPPSDLRELVGDSSTLQLGTYSSLEYFELQRDAERVGLDVQANDTSVTTYIPLDRTTNQPWVIEDHHHAQQIVREMIDAGVQITEEIAD